MAQIVFGDWVEHGEDSVRPDAAYQVVQVRLRDGSTQFTAPNNHSGGRCDCCSVIRWWWMYDPDIGSEPNKNDVIAYRIGTYKE